MAINRSSISAQPISDNTDIAINLLNSFPPTGTEDVIDPPIAPTVLHGFYNDATDSVILFVTNRTGTRYIRVR